MNGGGKRGGGGVKFTPKHPEKKKIKKPSLIRVKGKNVSVQISVTVNLTSNLV